MILFALSLAAALLAAPDDFDGAVGVYETGAYAEAAAAFAELAAAEPDAARRALLHANAGTSAARADRLGRALWHLESASAHAPRDELVQRNLILVRQWLAESDVVPDRLEEPLTALALQLDAAERRLLAASLLGLALLLLALRRAGWLGRGAVQLAIALGLLGGGFTGAAWHAERARADAAVLFTDAAVLGEPDPASEARFHLAEGSEVRAYETRAAHRLIETADGTRGWLPADALASLDL